MKYAAHFSIFLSVFVASQALAQDQKPQEAKPEEAKPEEAKSEEAKPEGSNSPEAKPTKPTETPAAESGSVLEDSDYAIKLRNLEERVNDLKERIFRSKARLILLRETVLNGVISGAKAQIVHRNEMGSSFTLEQVSYSLDGAPLFNKTDTEGALDDQEEIELFNGSIVPGNHNISVYLMYRGNGYGVFSYLKGYTFKIKSSYAFTAEEGKVTTVKVVGYEQGGFTTDLKDRPAVRYDVEVKQDAGDQLPPTEGGAAPATQEGAK